MRHHGFSLVELSIVLVILGLLVGGILAGQSLIRAGELRSVSADLTKFETAIYAFRDKYMALPGDMTNATSFWGDQATGTNACASAATADGTPGTCNGNGDGWVTISPGAEAWRAWQQLGLSGLIEGSYAGTQWSWGSNAKPGTDVPAAKISNGGYMYGYLDSSNSEFWYSDITYQNNFLIAGALTTTWPGGALFTPTDAWNIDRKLDDGQPGKGKMRGGRAGTCTDTNTSSSNYLLTAADPRCILGKIL